MFPLEIVSPSSKQEYLTTKTPIKIQGIHQDAVNVSKNKGNGTRAFVILTYLTR